MGRTQAKMVVVGSMAMLFWAQISMAGVAIKIDGLTGAQNWGWYEAEYASSVTNAVIGGDWESAISGGGMGAACAVKGSSSNPIGFTLNLVTPANMTNAYLYLRHNGGDVRTATVTVGGSTVGTFNTISNGYNYGNPIYWQTDQVNMGALNQGACNLGISVNSAGWWEGQFDGVFISDGPINVSNNPLTPNVAGDWWRWMGLPSDAGTHIVNGTATPVFTVTGQSSVSYSLDGAAYTPGTAITSLGSHQLSVIAYDGAKRYMSGANFVLVPEPLTIGLLGIGGLALLRRRRA